MNLMNFINEANNSTPAPPQSQSCDPNTVVSYYFSVESNATSYTSASSDYSTAASTLKNQVGKNVIVDAWKMWISSDMFRFIKHCSHLYIADDRRTKLLLARMGALIQSWCEWFSFNFLNKISFASLYSIYRWIPASVCIFVYKIIIMASRAIKICGSALILEKWGSKFVPPKSSSTDPAIVIFYLSKTATLAFLPQRLSSNSFRY